METIRHATSPFNTLPMMTISTQRVILRKRPEDLAGARPDLCILMSYQANGSAEYMIPELWISGSSAEAHGPEKDVADITLEEVEARFKAQPELKELFKAIRSIPEPKQTYVLRIILSRIQKQKGQIKQ